MDDLILRVFLFGAILLIGQEIADIAFVKPGLRLAGELLVLRAEVDSFLGLDKVLVVIEVVGLGQRGFLGHGGEGEAGEQEKQ